MISAATSDPAHSRNRLILGLSVFGGVVAVVVALGSVGLVTTKGIADASGLLLLGVVVVFFAWLLTSRQWNTVERKRLLVVLGLFIAAAIFWSVFEQAGSTMNLFAERKTDRSVLGYEFPAPSVSVSQFYVPDLTCSRVCVVVGAARITGTFKSGQVFVRLVTGGSRISYFSAGRSGSGHRRQSKSHVAGCDVLIAYDGRALLEPGWAERNDEAGAARALRG